MSHQMLHQKISRETRLRDYLIKRIFSEISDVKLNGCLDARLPGNVNVSFKGINGGAVVALLDLEGICVSAASACSTGSEKPSHVQLAIGNSREEAYGAVRFTLGPQNTKEELDITVDVLKKTVARLRELK
jgi:cysteine desulfurase